MIVACECHTNPRTDHVGGQGFVYGKSFRVDFDGRDSLVQIEKSTPTWNLINSSVEFSSVMSERNTVGLDISSLAYSIHAGITASGNSSDCRKPRKGIKLSCSCGLVVVSRNDRKMDSRSIELREGTVGGFTDGGTDGTSMEHIACKHCF